MSNSKGKRIVRSVAGENLAEDNGVYTFSMMNSKPRRFETYTVRITALEEDLRIALFCPLIMVGEEERRDAKEAAGMMNTGLCREELRLCVQEDDKENRARVYLRGSLYFDDMSEEESANALEEKLRRMMERVADIDDMMLYVLSMNSGMAEDDPESILEDDPESILEDDPEGDLEDDPESILEDDPDVVEPDPEEADWES